MLWGNENQHSSSYWHREHDEVWSYVEFLAISLYLSLSLSLDFKGAKFNTTSLFAVLAVYMMIMLFYMFSLCVHPSCFIISSLAHGIKE